MKKPSIRSSHTVFRGYFDVRTDQLERSDGKIFDYSSMVLMHDAAIVVAEDGEGHLILNREYRHPTGEWILGCPGGSIEKGENPIQGAQRELFEETGYWSDEISLLGTCYPLPGLLNQKIHFLHAKNAIRKSGQHLDPFEFIEIKLMNENELKKEILAGAPIDSLMCTALWYKSLAAC